MDFIAKLSRVFGTWFGCGLTPKAPGTFGTLGAIPLYWAFVQLGDVPYMAAVLIFTVLTIGVAYFFEMDGAHDAPEFVMDEVAGFLVTMTWVPLTGLGVVAGFIAFRFFDILKPFPISWVDRRVPGAIGTVADDLLAGIFANIVLQVALQNGVAL